MIRCTICNFEIADSAGLNVCPKCGTMSLPMDSADDLSVRINWHELRILAIWAEFHADAHESESKPNQSMRQAVYSIVRRLEVQHPGKTPLTLGGELRQLKKEFPDMQTNVPYDEGFDPTEEK